MSDQWAARRVLRRALAIGALAAALAGTAAIDLWGRSGLGYALLFSGAAVLVSLALRRDEPVSPPIPLAPWLYPSLLSGAMAASLLLTVSELQPGLLSGVR